jgi:hypothetical protein
MYGAAAVLMVGPAFGPVLNDSGVVVMGLTFMVPVYTKITSASAMVATAANAIRSSIGALLPILILFIIVVFTFCSLYKSFFQFSEKSMVFN